MIVPMDETTFHTEYVMLSWVSIHGDYNNWLLGKTVDRLSNPQ
jgi:hypothetical protein